MTNLLILSLFLTLLTHSVLIVDALDVKKPSRRQALQTIGTSAALLGGAILPTPSTANAALSDSQEAVLVIGAAGKTGRACVDYLISQTQRPCIATTRSGSSLDVATASSSRLSFAACDVTSPSSIRQALSQQRLGGVIYAASASAKGGDAFAVDRDGVVETAKACLDLLIPRLVIVSSGAVTRPDSVIYKLLNLAGKGIMEAKIDGENQVRQLYAAAKTNDKVGYTIIRPGGLTLEDPVDVSNVELNQGDQKSGRIPRANVAALCVECLESSDAFDTTFECYLADTAKPLESVGLSNLLKSKDPTSAMTGKERRGDTYAALFRGLEKDV